MSNPPASPDFEFDPLHSTTVTLSEAAIDWAIQISQLEANVALQWQSFLRALALKGFQQWVEAGAWDMALYYDPERAPTAGINCRVGDFRLCLIVQGSLSDEVVPILTHTVNSPEDFAHLHVLLEVQEEARRVRILSGLRRDRLLAIQQTGRLVLNADGTCTVPVECFDSSPEDVLLYLNCLNPEQLAAPVEAPSAVTTSPFAAWRSRSVADVINVSYWLQNRLDEVANRLTWTLLPLVSPMATATGLRRSTADIRDILTEIAPEVMVPPNAKGAYTDCQFLGLPFRLYALTWTLVASEEPEWSLLLCLGPSGNSQLPPGVRLRIRDRTAVLIEQSLEPDSASTYLYGQVIGTWNEQFSATVELPDGTILSWPAFIFQPDT